MVVADERYEDLLAEQPATAPDVGERSPDDHYGLWTGGTTGMPKGVMWRQEDIYLSAIGGNGNPLLGIEPVQNLDDVAARARKGTPLPGTLTLCPLMHGGGFWLAFAAILSGSFSVLIRDVGFDPAFALRVDRRGAREPADDDRRRVRAPDRRPARGSRARRLRPLARCSCTDRAARSCRRR